MRRLAPLLVLVACGRSATTSPSTPVTAAFPAHASWNAYVQRASGPVWTFPDVDCDATTNSCVHAGEVRRYDVRAQTTCDGLTASDDLDAFVWVCDDTTGHAVFYSTALTTRLADLLSGLAFAPNAVTIKRAATVIDRSASTVWWDNPVLPLPDDEPTGALSTTLSTPSAVYVATSPRTRGYRIAADGISVVVPRNQTLALAPGNGSPCTTLIGPPLGTRCVLQVDGRHFVWIEGYLDGANEAGIAIGINNASFVRVRNVDTQRGRYGVLIDNGHAIDVTHYRCAEIARYGIIVYGGNHVRIADSLFSANGIDNGAAAILVNFGATDVSIVDVLIDAGRPFGILVQEAPDIIEQRITIAFATIVNGTASAIASNWTTGLTISQVVAANYGGAGIDLGPDVTATVAQVASLDNTYGVSLDHAGTVRFDRSVMLGGNTNDCSAISDPTTDATCDFIGPGVITGVAASGGFAGATATTSGFSTITQWLTDAPFHTWNTDAPAFPDASAMNSCIGSTCRIFDWRITGGGVAFRSATGTPSGPLFTPGAACPTINALTDAQNNTYLVDALEILDDGSGDDDGLCEADEACIYAPHIGAYLGEGDLTEACQYAGTDVPGVTLRAFSQPLAD